MAKIKNSKRSDGRIKATVYIGLDENGKKKYKYVYARTAKELEKNIDEVKLRMGKGIDVSAERDTFGFWLEKWLRFKKTDVSENWHKVLTINSQKLSEIEDCAVIKLRAVDLQEILVELAEKEYSKRVIKAVRDIAIGTFDFAIENRIVDYNPFRCTHIPTKTKDDKKRRALTLEEQSWIVDTPHRAQLPAMIMMYAGLRRGELFALCWNDIDLENGTITVNKSVIMKNGKPIIKQGGKTAAATRTVYIPHRLSDYLKKQSKKNLLVCPTVSGHLMTDSGWRRLWESYLRILNEKYGRGLSLGRKGSNVDIPMMIPPFTAHWLRHTFVTNLYHAGVDVAVARDQAGHSDIKTTLEIYTTLDKECRVQGAEKIDKYLDRRKA